MHSSDVLELKFHKSSLFCGGVWRFQPGQYVYLNCPELSWFQWHPFSLTSCPEDGSMSVHIHAKGDWTRALVSKFEQAPMNKCPRIHVDGPYDAVAGDIMAYDIAVMIGGGIGVTPFASWLKSLKHRVHHPSGLGTLKKVYFIWICRDIANFKWFLDILQEIERDPKCREMICISLYCTSKNKDDRRQTMQTVNTRRISGLQCFRAHIGRPTMKNILKDVADEAKHELYRRSTWIPMRTQVGVFCCAPKALNQEVKQLCSDMSERLVNFEYQQEY
jgi:NADPH oxidase